jgi:hypothetical protein
MGADLSTHDLTGEPIENLICALLRELDNISHVNLFVPPPVPTIQTRLVGAQPALEIVGRALQIRDQLGLPFWDAANLACFGAGVEATLVAKEALFHNGEGVRHLRLSAASITPDALKNLAAIESGLSILVWSSKVETGTGEAAHIPMLDFHCPQSAPNLELVTKVLCLLDIGPGFILESGKSYHFYGRKLITDSERILFLSRALLLAPIVDRAWIAHQLLEGACGLRISPRQPSGMPPRVVRKL